MPASHKGSYFTVLISLRREWKFQSSYCQQLRHSQMTIYYLTLFLKGEMTASLSKLAGEQLSGAYSPITHSHDLLNRNQDTLFFTQEPVLGHLNLTSGCLIDFFSRALDIAIKNEFKTGMNCEPINSDVILLQLIQLPLPLSFLDFPEDNQIRCSEWQIRNGIIAFKVKGDCWRHQ